MGTKGTQPPKKENPYKVLYWMGAGLVVLALGVAALIMFVDTGPKERPPFERTLLWIYDAENPGSSALVALLEEGQEAGTLTVATAPAPAEVVALFQETGSARKALKEVESLVGRTVQNRVFLPYQTIQTLVDSVSGIEMGDRLLTGSDAVAYIKEGGEKGPERAFAVLMRMADIAMNKRAPNMSVSEGLALARQIETNMDLMAIPEVLGRWSGYSEPKIAHLPALTRESVSNLFQPDPADSATP